MAPENDYIVFQTPNGRLYTKRFSPDATDEEYLFRGSHEACMDFLSKTHVVITRKISASQVKAQTRQKIAKMILNLEQGDLDQVLTFISELKAKR